MPPHPEGPLASTALGGGSLARAVVETVRAPLLVLDERMTVVQANPAFFDTFGLAAGGTLGHDFFDLAESRWDAQEFRPTLEHALQDRDEIRDLELRLPRSDVGERIVSVSARTVRLEGAEQRLLLLALDDVTERHALQEQARDYAARLERSNRDLQDFAHAASHDLQEPLRKVRTYAHRVHDRLGAERLDERTTQDLARMVEAVERMQARIDDLLRLARVGRAEPRFQRTPLDELVAAVLADLEIAIQESDARVSVEPLPEVDADPSQLALLLQNLIANALKFHDEGQPPIVRIRALPPQRDVSRGLMQRIVVEDEGIGFEPQYAERIFTPFERLHGRNRYEGSGVGLALCRRIAEHHGGTVTAESEPGGGSRFIVTLPARQRTTEALP